MGDEQEMEKMTDISKIDFSKCKLRCCMTAEFSAKTNLSVEAVFIRDRRLSILAVKNTGDGWRVRFSSQPLVEEVFELPAICSLVDEFIAAALKRTAEEEPSWRVCPLDEAMSHPGCSEWRYGDRWKPTSEMIGNGNAAGYSYRTRAPKADAKVSLFKIGDKVRVADQLDKRDFTGCSRVPGAVGVVESESNSHGLCYGVRHTPGILGWYDPDELTIDEPKPESKIPSVTAPDGYRWTLNQFDGKWLIAPESEGHLYSVPGTRCERDAMLACVVAYDEQRETGSCQIFKSVTGEKLTLAAWAQICEIE